MLNTDKKVKKVLVYTPIKLTDSQISEVRTKAESLFGEGFEVIQEIDPNIFGGIVIKFGSKTLDLSANSELIKINDYLDNE